jgi:hypothetical protein
VAHRKTVPTNQWDHEGRRGMGGWGGGWGGERENYDDTTLEELRNNICCEISAVVREELLNS